MKHIYTCYRYFPLMYIRGNCSPPDFFGQMLPPQISDNEYGKKQRKWVKIDQN